MRFARLAYAPLLFAAVTLAACDGKAEMTPEQVAKTSAERIESGMALIAGDQEAKAKVEFDWVLERDPDNAQAHAGLAAMYLKQDKASEALPHAEKAAAGASEDAQVQATLGKALAKTGKLAEAAAAYEKAWTLAPDDARWGLAQGKALLKAKDWAKAETVLRKVGEMDDEIQYVWSSLGDALREQDKQDEALRMYMKAQNKYESDKSAFAGATMVYEAKGETSKAIDQVSRYIQRDCCSTYSDEWAKPKLAELKAKENDG